MLLGAIAAGFAPQAAAQVDVTITADNTYSVGYGTAAGVSTFVGGVNNTSAGQIFNCVGGSETYLNMPAPANSYIYVVAYSDNSVTQGVLGHFVPASNTNGSVAYTGTSDWQVFATGIDVTAPPTVANVNAQIALANACSGGVGSSGGWVGVSGNPGCTTGALAIGEPNSPGGTFPEVCSIAQVARWMWYNPTPSTIANPFAGDVKGEYLIFRLPTAQVTAQCQGPFTGGAIPATGTGGGGSYPATLPGSPSAFSATVTPPPGGAVLKSVKLNGLSHTWGGNVSIFLESPAGGGTLHTLFNGMPTNTNFDWTSNNYEIVDPLEACRTPLPYAATPDGIYTQNFGGPAGAWSNTPLQSIPVSAGTWNLYIYDWVAADTGSLTSWELCFGPAGNGCPPLLPPPPAGICAMNGAGTGPIPALGTGGTGAVWPGTLPANPYANSYSVDVPAGSSGLLKVDLEFGPEHTWAGHLFVVLTDPTGGQHNIVHRPGFAGTGAGLNCDLGGLYSFYDPSQFGVGLLPTACPGSGNIPAGNYQQSFGNWNSGDLGIFNTPICQIPVPAGVSTWTLTIYDWAGGQTGTLVDWKLCFKAPPAPTPYCIAGTTTNGCNAWISANTNPNVFNNAGVTISVANVEGQKQGIFFYGVNNNGFTPTPWGPGSTSFLCVKGPTQRAGSQGSGGTTNACDGAFSLNWDAFVAANPFAVGVPFVAGDKVYAQAWFRDPPAPKTTNLSNAIEMTVTP